MRVACVGVGVIGRGWAVAFARGGAQVALYDADRICAAAALPRIADSLRDLERFGLLEDASAAIGRVALCETLEEAVSDATYVQESAFESVAVKRGVFEAIARAAPAEAIVGSSASALPGSQFMEGLANAAQCLVAHPTNPPFLTPLTELCPTPWTSAETLARARALLESIGQRTIIVRREITGYVLNRLQAAVVAEALFLVESGVVSARDLDATLTHGLGLRWCLMGPFLTGHLNAEGGYRDYMTRYGDVYRQIAGELDRNHAWTADTIEIAHQSVAESAPNPALGQAWRDRRLMRLLNHLSEASRSEPSPGENA